jgi:uncharacterized protein (TIGR00251 family)
VLRTPTGVAFSVRLTPKSRTDHIEGWIAGPDGRQMLKARVAAAPEQGKANASLVALLAECLEIPKSSIAITSGSKSRLKSVRIAGDAAALAARLGALGESK